MLMHIKGCDSNNNINVMSKYYTVENCITAFIFTSHIGEYCLRHFRNYCKI